MMVEARSSPNKPVQAAASGQGEAIPIHGVSPQTLEAKLSACGAVATTYAAACGYKAEPGEMLVVPRSDGALDCVLFGVDGAKAPDRYLPGKLATLLPSGTFALADGFDDLRLAAIAFERASYRFTRFRSADKPQPRLATPAGVDGGEVALICDAIAFGRDLINRPANDLGPDALEAACRDVAESHGVRCAVVRGDDLMTGFPLIHAVGRAAAEAPRLVDFAWGAPEAPKVTLVGKGVCFDTGGLDIKPSSAMLLMKKDMGGAATALALAAMIMGAKLPVRLRVLVPIVENAIAGNAFRPGDVLASRKGLTVEIGNTDAEGRLILADALSLADEDAPDLLFDFATLTGAARVALGPDLPPFYTDDEALGDAVAIHAAAANDPCWRMPLWAPYDKLLKSRVADLNNVSGGPFAGSITAALFLRRFVSRTAAWAHFDVYGWNPTTKPGRPEGGEIQTAQALFELIRERFGAAARAC